MRRFKYFLASFILLLLFANIGFAQQLLVFDKTFTYPFIVAENNNLNPRVLKVVNRIKKMDNQSDFSFAFTIELKFKVTKDYPNNYVLISELLKKDCPDGVKYRNFDICSEFFPIGVNFIHELIWNKNKQNIVQEANLKLQKNVKQVFSWIDSNYTQIEIKPNLESLVYNQEWENIINQKLDLIDLYYQSDSLFSSWDSIISSIRLEQIELLPIYDFLLDDVEKTMEYFNNKNILSIIDPNQENHNSFKNRITEINIKASQKRLLLTEYLHWIDYRFIEKARNDLKISNPMGAIYNYSKALEYNPLCIQALSELARLMLEQNNLIEASGLIKILFSRTWPQGKTYTECRKVASDVYSAILKKGNLLLKDEEFHRAIEAFSIGYIFCDSIRENICSNEYYQGIIKSKYGILRSYFNVINKALQKDLLEIAENYAYEAKKYQIANQKEISDDTEIQVIVDKIISKYVSISIRNIENGKFEIAIKQLQSADSLGHTFRDDFSLKYLDESRKRAFNGAFAVALSETQLAINNGNVILADSKHRNTMSFYHQHPEWITDTSLAFSAFLDIRKLDIKNKIIQGNKLYTQGLFSSSLSLLQEAKTIETTYKIQSDTLLDSLLLAISKPIAFEKLNSVSMMIWRNELLESKVIIEDVEALIKKSKLENNLELMNLFHSTKRKYEFQECDYANTRINYLENFYTKCMSSQSFRNALTALDSIQIIQVNFSRCIEHPKSYQAEYKIVKPAAMYESLIQNCDIEFRLKNVNQAMIYYFTADSVYNSFKMNEVGVFQKSLSSFLDQSPDNNLIIESCNWLLNSSHFDQVIPLLSILERSGFSANKTRNIQKSVAVKLRNKDKLEHPSVKSNDLLKLYPVNSKWYFIFRLYYSKNPITALFSF